MGARGGVVALGGVGGSNFVALIYKLEDLVFAADELLHEALNLNFLTAVLQQFELLVVVEKVINFPPINFVHRYCYREIALVRLPVVDAAVEQIGNSQLLEALHRVGLS